MGWGELGQPALADDLQCYKNKPSSDLSFFTTKFVNTTNFVAEGKVINTTYNKTDRSCWVLGACDVTHHQLENNSQSCENPTRNCHTGAELRATPAAPALAALPAFAACAQGTAVSMSFYFPGLWCNISNREEIVHLHTKPE